MARPRKPAPPPAPRPVARYYLRDGAFLDGTAYVEEDSAGEAAMVDAEGRRRRWPGPFAGIAAGLVRDGIWRKEVL